MKKNLSFNESKTSSTLFKLPTSTIGVHSFHKHPSTASFSSLESSNPHWLNHIIITEYGSETGAVIKHQVPRRIPGSTSHHNVTSPLRDLPDLLISYHKNSKSQEIKDDFHLVILYKDSNNQYMITPPVAKDGLLVDFTISEETYDEAGNNSINELEDDSVLFLYTLSRAYFSDDSIMKVRSITFAITQRWFGLLKEVMTEVLTSYFKRPTSQTLIQAFSNLSGISLGNQSLALPLNEFTIPEAIGPYLLKFLKQLTNSIPTPLANLTIIIHTEIQSASFLTDFIISLTGIFNGFMKYELYDGMVEYYPVVDISTFETVANTGFSDPKFKIIGTRNSLIGQLKSSYDLFYNIDDASMTVGTSSVASNCEKIHRVSSDLSIFLSQLHKGIKFSDLSNSLRSFNIQQLIKLTKINNSEEIALRTLYLKLTRSPTLFEEYFSFKSIELIELILTYLTSIDSDSCESNSTSINSLNSICSNIKNKSDAELFFSILNHFPTFSLHLNTCKSQDPISDFFKPLLWRTRRASFIDSKTSKSYTIDDIKILLTILFQKLTIDFEIDLMNELLTSIINIRLYGSDYKRFQKLKTENICSKSDLTSLSESDVVTKTSSTN